VPFWKARPWLRRLVRLALLYLGIILVLLWLENRLLFAGAGRPASWEPAPADFPCEEFYLDSADGSRIVCRWFAPPGWRPEDGAFHFSHGNGHHIGVMSDYVRLWRAAGFRQAMLVYDYPGYGMSGGSPTEAGCYASGEAALLWLRETKKVPPGRIVLMGASLGCGITFELASRHECRAVVAMAAFTSFPDVAQLKFPWLPARWLVSNQFNNLKKIAALRCPVFLAHGTADTLVSPAHAERLYANAPQGSRLLMLEGMPHMYPDRREFFAAVREWLAR
jgi:fermentation-respiration switch protein FrsA (DUF1100 family)